MHVAFAAGSGITPVLSIMRTVLARGTRSRFFLFYGSRSDRGHPVPRGAGGPEGPVLGAAVGLPCAVAGAAGRGGAERPAGSGEAARAAGDALRGVAIDAAYVCGPDGMIEESGGGVARGGGAEARMHVERFISALGGRPRAVRGRPDAPAYATAALRVEGGARGAGGRGRGGAGRGAAGGAGSAVLVQGRDVQHLPGAGGRGPGGDGR